AALMDWINKPEGRKYRNGTAKERAGFANVHLHLEEHIQAGLAKKAQDKAVQPIKPPTKTISIDKLPPGPAADMAAQAGIQATPQDFAAQDVADAAEKHPGVVQ